MGLESWPDLEVIVTLLNLETEDTECMKQAKQFVEIAEGEWSRAQQGGFSDDFNTYLRQRHITRALDTIPLKVQGAAVQYRGLERTIQFNAEFRQGELVGIVSVFVAPHLRVLHVSAEPLFFNKRSLLENLCAGLPVEEHKASLDRVRRILIDLGLGGDVLKRLQDENYAAWREIFSYQQCQLLNLARALIASPEVIIAQTPMLPFHSTTRGLVLSALREFVDYRGFGEDPQRFSMRHPRTCILSVVTRSPGDSAKFDRVLEMQSDCSLVSCSSEDVGREKCLQ